MSGCASWSCPGCGRAYSVELAAPVLVPPVPAEWITPAGGLTVVDETPHAAAVDTGPDMSGRPGTGPKIQLRGQSIRCGRELTPVEAGSIVRKQAE